MSDFYVAGIAAGQDAYEPWFCCQYIPQATERWIAGGNASVGMAKAGYS